MKRNLLLFCTLFLVYGIGCNSPSGYKITNKFKIDGDGGWDDLACDDQGRLYLSHGTVVQVVDDKTGQVLGTIPDTKGVHGIAIAADLNKGFISDGKDTAVTVFDLKTFAVITKVHVTGLNPDAILYDPFTNRVFTFNGKSQNATILDGKADTVIATLPLDGKPEFAVTDGKGKVFLNIEDKSTVCVINTTTLKIEQTWPIAPGEEASGLALDNENHRLFAVCDNKLMVVMDAQTGKVITTLPIGEGADGAVFDPGNKRAYSSNGEGTLTVVQEDSNDQFKVLENVPTQKGARTMTIDLKTHHLFLPTAGYGLAPEATKDNPKPRKSILPGTFVVLDIEPVK